MEAGAVIWVKYAGWPLWPARVSTVAASASEVIDVYIQLKVAKLCEASPLVMKAQRKDRFLVYFFGYESHTSWSLYQY